MRHLDHNLHPVARLHYAWTGWPTEGTAFPPLPPLEAAIAGWQGDGMELKAQDASAARIMLTFRAAPHVAPVLLAQRAKGRLQHAFRTAGASVDFSRKVSVMSLGENLTDTVEQYIRDQLVHADLADPRYRRMLAEAAFEDPSVSLDEPAATHSGRYGYNLHIVLVTADRSRLARAESMLGLRDKTLAAALQAGFAVKMLAVMPDHLHVAVRGWPEQSPQEIGLAIQNTTAEIAGYRLWQDGFYVGTFGAYALDLVRRRAGWRYD